MKETLISWRSALAGRRQFGKTMIPGFYSCGYLSRFTGYVGFSVDNDTYSTRVL